MYLATISSLVPMYVLCSSLASLPEYLTRESHKVVRTFESVRNPMVSNLFDSTFKFSTNKVSHHFGNFAERVETRRWASRDSTNQNALFVEWFSRLGRAVFRGVYVEIFALFQASVGNFYPIRPWKVVRTLYPDSSYVTLKIFCFLERLWQVWIAWSCTSRHDDLSVVFAVLLGFIAGYC